MKSRYLIPVSVLTSAVALTFLLAPTVRSTASPEPEQKGPQVNSRLRVRLPDGPDVSLKAGEFPVELKFTNFEPEEKQSLSLADFTFAILDESGQQVNGGLISHYEPGEKVVLKGPTTTVRPRLQLDPVVKAGAEYYFVCVIGNQSGLVKFKVKK